MKYKKAVITSGPTREWIDPVRFISNASSGKMGFHIANEVSKWIPETVYLHGNLLEKYSRPNTSRIISVETTLEMLSSLVNELEDDMIIIMTAAPADYRPKDVSEIKIKKNSTEGNLILEFVHNPDILKNVSHEIQKRGLKNIKLFGFAAETHNMEENSKAKLEKKGLELIFANHVGKGVGFGELDSTINVYSMKGLEKTIGPSPKEQIAKDISDFLKQRLAL
jgi:phosphopantothenoylcysteine decarboxylase/phosphopantothenate--cysteine ligase